MHPRQTQSADDVAVIYLFDEQNEVQWLPRQELTALDSESERAGRQDGTIPRRSGGASTVLACRERINTEATYFILVSDHVHRRSMHCCVRLVAIDADNEDTTYTVPTTIDIALAIDRITLWIKIGLAGTCEA